MKQIKQQFVLISLLSVGTVIAVVFAYSLFYKKNKSVTISSPSPSLSVSPTPLSSPSDSPSPKTSVSPTNSPSTLNNKQQAQAAYQKKDYTTAIAKYQLAIKETSNKTEQAQLWNLLGNAYRDNKNITEATASYKKAYSLDPHLVSSYINLSNLYLSQNNTTDAKATLETGLKANPDDKDLKFELSTLSLNGPEGST